MFSCPNCGQETSGDSCLWCGYPIMKAKTLNPKGADKEGEGTKERTKMKTEEANKAKSEAKEAKEQAKRASKEAKKEKKAAEEAKKTAAKEAKEEAKKTGKETSSELYKGTIKLTIMPPVDLGQVRKLEEHLSQIKDLSVVLIGGSTAEGNEIIISAENPIPLMDVLQEMPPVAQVNKKGKTTQITLKTE